MSAATINDSLPQGPQRPAGSLAPGDVLGPLRIVRIIDERMALASRQGDPSGFIVLQWPQATAADLEAVSAPPEASPHPHWLPITDVVHHEGTIAVVHRAVTGPSLANFLRRMHPSPTQVDALARQIIAAVEAAHRHQRVVGTLDPRTIWLARERTGVAPHLVGVGLMESLPEPGRYVRDVVDGRFVAPEVRDGAPPTIASDRYALGAVLLQLVTGHPPSPSAAPDLEELPERVQRTLRSCLDPDPVARPLDVLASWTHGHAMPTCAWEPTQVERLSRLAPHHAGASITDTEPRYPRPAEEPPAPAPDRRLPVVVTGTLLVLAAALSMWCSS